MCVCVCVYIYIYRSGIGVAGSDLFLVEVTLAWYGGGDQGKSPEIREGGRERERGGEGRTEGERERERKRRGRGNWAGMREEVGGRGGGTPVYVAGGAIGNSCADDELISEEAQCKAAATLLGKIPYHESGAWYVHVSSFSYDVSSATLLGKLPYHQSDA
jgi:hypothetical protein